MYLNLQEPDYDRDIAPYVRNGIIIDTSVFKIIVDGIIATRFTKKDSPEFKYVISFLELIKANNKWDKFFITPHVLTEVCTHVRHDFNKWTNYKEIVEEIFPMLDSMGEFKPNKDEILAYIDLKQPLVEIGDISIFAVTDNFVRQSQKTAILAIDEGLNARYLDNKDVLILDYRQVLNLL